MGRFLWIILFLLISCKRDEGICLKSAGKDSKEIRVIQGFNHLKVQGSFPVTIVPALEYKLEINGGKNLFAGIVNDLNNDTLTLRNTNACTWFRNYKDNDIAIRLYTPGLDHVTLYNGSSIYSEDTLRFGMLEIECWENGGEIDLQVDLDTMILSLHTGPTIARTAGNANVAYYYSAGDGRIEALNTIVNSCSINHSGNNNFYVHANNNLNVQIFNQGNVYYIGNPVIDLKDEGPGSLINQP